MNQQLNSLYNGVTPRVKSVYSHDEKSKQYPYLLTDSLELYEGFYDGNKWNGDSHEILESLINPLHLCKTDAEKRALKEFTSGQYERHFPELAGQDKDEYFAKGVNFYGVNHKGEIESTVSMIHDFDLNGEERTGFEETIDFHNQRGINCIKVGRFIISPKAESATLRDYLRLFYVYGKLNRSDVLMGLVREKDKRFHEKFIGAKIVSDTDLNFGSEHEFSVVIWELNNLTKRFYNLIGVNQ